MVKFNKVPVYFIGPFITVVVIKRRTLLPVMEGEMSKDKGTGD